VRSEVYGRAGDSIRRAVSGCRFAGNRTSAAGRVAYFAGQVAEIMRTEETFSRCAFAIDELPPLDVSDPVVPVVPVAPLLVDPLVVSSVPVTSI
jgi:hypothetical protein